MVCYSGCWPVRSSGPSSPASHLRSRRSDENDVAGASDLGPLTRLHEMPSANKKASRARGFILAQILPWGRAVLLWSLAGRR
jgi:hypothetical protein